MPVSMMVVGLGNPGRQYERTRHNLGFLAVMSLARNAGVEWKPSRQANALTAEISENGSSVLLVLPLTYMNNSGEAVRSLAHFYKVTPQNILVVVDDIRLDFGDMRLRQEGSDGGHNGLKSVSALLDSNKYPRLRLGVGSPLPRMSQVDFVLAEFSANEIEKLPVLISGAGDCCQMWMKGESDRAMTVYNKRKEKMDNE